IAVTTTRLHAQSTATISGTVLDPKGSVVPGATVTARNDSTRASRHTVSDPQGRFSISPLPAGTYTVEVSAVGFEDARRLSVQLAAGASQELSLSLKLSNVAQQVTVQADEVNSVAAQLAPMEANLSETSARTEISSAFIQNFTAPTAD